MARIIYSDTIDDSIQGQLAYFIYNALDSCLTLEVFHALEPQLTPATRRVYDFERALQGPVMEMMLRGVLIDKISCSQEISTYSAKRARLQQMLDRLALAVWGKALNPNSPKQLQDFFYGALGLPPVVSFKKGVRKVSTDRASLEKLSAYLYARPFVNIILALRDCTKTLSVLSSGVDPDGRIRASYNIAGTETGRMSSSENAFGTGTNLQNITEKLRGIFIADSGMKLAYCDLEQAESRAVGMICWSLFGDSAYIDACEGGDLHTLVCKMVWEQLQAQHELCDDEGKLLCPAGTRWGVSAKLDKTLAKQPFYRDFSYRDMAKRGGHGTNYGGRPATMAKHLKVEERLVADFQRKYFSAFPGIPRWHKEVVKKIQLEGQITTFMGRVRTFFGRQSDDSTIREGIAFEPQSVVADIEDLGIWRLWKHLGTRIQILGQIHDAVLFQYPAHEEDEIIPRALELLRTTFTIAGREFSIPVEAMTGWNWEKHHQHNPDGLMVFHGHDSRTRTVSPDTPLLHRPLR